MLYYALRRLDSGGGWAVIEIGEDEETANKRASQWCKQQYGVEWASKYLELRVVSSAVAKARYGFSPEQLASSHKLASEFAKAMRILRQIKLQRALDMEVLS